MASLKMVSKQHTGQLRGRCAGSMDTLSCCCQQDAGGEVAAVLQASVVQRNSSCARAQSPAGQHRSTYV
jgi:hypothetical protein